jgi:hypothetical protein
MSRAGPSTRVRVNEVLVLRSPGQGVPHPLVPDIGWVPCVGNGILHAYLPRRSHSPFVHLLVCAMRLSIDLRLGWRGRGADRIGCGCVTCGQRELC